MTVTSQVSRDDYTGNGATATYAWTFPVFDTSELIVYTEDADGYDDLLTLGADFTAARNSDGTGAITLTAGDLATGKKLSIQRGIPYTQTTNLTQSSQYSAATMQRTVDRLCQEIIRLKGEVDRCLKVPHLETGGDAVTKLPSATNRSDRYLSFDEDGNATVEGVAELTGITVTAFAETLLDDANANEVRTTLAVPSQSMAARTVVANDTGSTANGSARSIDDLTVLADGSTARRDLSARFGETLNVKDFGATGNGVTDDTAAIQAAFSAAPTTGGHVHFPVGNYRITAAITWVGKNALRISGVRSGQDSVNRCTRIFCDTNGIRMLDGRDALHVHIDGLLIDGNSKAAYGISLGISATHDQHVQVKDVAINAVTVDAGVALSLSYNADGSGSVADSEFSNVQISTCKIGVDNYAQNNKFYNCVVAGCSTAGLIVRNVSHSSWFGGIYSGNSRDIYLETGAVAQGQSFYGVWFETSTNGIVSAVGGSCSAPISFINCSLSTASTSSLMDFTAINGPITIIGGTNFPVGPSSSNIVTNSSGSYYVANYLEGSGTPISFTGNGRVYHLRGSLWVLDGLRVKGLADGVASVDRVAGNNALFRWSTAGVGDYYAGVRYDLGGDWALCKEDGTILLRRSASVGATDAEGTAAPTSGTWARGSRVWNTTPSAGGIPGWVCTAGGTPGTWNAMAAVAP